MYVTSPLGAATGWICIVNVVEVRVVSEGSTNPTGVASSVLVCVESLVPHPITVQACRRKLYFVNGCNPKKQGNYKSITYITTNNFYNVIFVT